MISACRSTSSLGGADGGSREGMPGPHRRCAVPRLAFACAALLLSLGSGAAFAAHPRVEVGDLVLEAPPGLEGDLSRLADAARRIVPQLERDLGVRARGPYRIVLLPSARPLDAELQRIDALAPSWAAGFLVGGLRIGAIRMGQIPRYPYDSAEEVLAHEIVHMLLHDAAREPVPPWFGEGVATWEGRRRGVRDLVVGASALLARQAPTLAQIDAAFDAGPERARRAYAASFDFVAWSVRRHGAELVPQIVARLDQEPLENAWRSVTGESLGQSERAWRRRSVWFHQWLPILGSTGTLWIGISLLAVFAGLARRRRDRELRARWDAEEALARAAVAATQVAEPALAAVEAATEDDLR
jgi:hypothetical protein